MERIKADGECTIDATEPSLACREERKKVIEQREVFCNRGKRNRGDTHMMRVQWVKSTSFLGQRGRVTD